MSDSKRARIFMPFDALKGFKEAIRERERIVVPKIELTEDDYESLNHAFMKIKKGTMVRISYYNNGEYILRYGMVSDVNEAMRYIKIVKEKIPLDDIQSIEIEGECDDTRHY